MTGRLPVLDLAVAKICSRSGVRRAEMHALDTNETRIRVEIKYCLWANGDLINGHRPATIDEARDKSSTKAVVDINDSNV